jgi:predicted amidohydrolase
MSPPDLNIRIVQADTVWHDPQANRDYYTALLAGLAPDADIIVLPETFTSGFSNEALAQAETMDGPTVAWLRAQSEALNAVITGSVQIREGDSVYNRMLWAAPDGSLAHYDKRHLFRMAGEHERYAAGRDKIIVEYKGWRICPLVCYDLRFPVFSRNRFAHGQPEGYDYDLLIYVANWPSPRHFAWQTLLKARAIENLSYVVGVNRTGGDGNGLHYLGGSTVLDFLGQTVVESGDTPQAQSARISHAELTAFRQRFPAHLDADSFTFHD